MFIFSSLHVFKIGSFNPLMLEIPCSAQRNYFFKSSQLFNSLRRQRRIDCAKLKNI